MCRVVMTFVALLMFVPISGCISQPPSVDEPVTGTGQTREQILATRAEVDALPYKSIEDVQELRDWLQLSSDRRSIFLNLAYFNNVRNHEHVCRDFGPIVMRGNFRARFDGPGIQVYCNPQNNWALLNIGRFMTIHDRNVLMCVNVTDRHNHWSQHGGSVWAPGLESVGGTAADGQSFNVVFTYRGDGVIELVNEDTAVVQRLTIRPC